MSAATVLELRKQRKDIAGRMNALIEKGTPEAINEWKALGKRADSLGDEISALEQHILERAEAVGSNRSRELPPIAGGSFTSDDYMDQREFVPGEMRDRGRISEIRSSRSYRAEFDNYLRTGEISTQQRELRAIGAASGADGATLVPQSFEAELETKIKYWGGVTNICRHLKTATGNPMPYPTLDDTANQGEFLAEGAGVGSADPTFGSVVFGATLVSSKQVKVSVQLEQDAAFDIAGLLSDAFGERLGRALDAAYLIGDGTGTYGGITGLLTALQAAGGRSVLAVGAHSNDNVSTDLNSVGTDDFSNLVDGLDYGYQRPTNKFLFNQSTLNALRKLKDEFGRPVWDVSLAMGQPDTVFGYGYQIDNAMAKIGAGNVPVIFGDFTKYVVRDVLGFTLVRFNELYMPNFQRAYQAFMRTDAKLMQSAAFSYLQTPLS
jgi:HK97 family phage major capsid protein